MCCAAVIGFSSVSRTHSERHIPSLRKRRTARSLGEVMHVQRTHTHIAHNAFPVVRSVDRAAVLDWLTN